MLVHGKMKSTKVNGPGTRCMIHFQSCTLGCKNCWNFSTHSVNLDFHVEDNNLLDWIVSNETEGITFSGGEPMQQADKLSKLISNLKLIKPNISIGLYTGYTQKELNKGRYKILKYIPNDNKSIKYFNAFTLFYNPWDNIKKHLDFAVMGRFNHLQIDTSRPLVSSRNQKLVLFNDRYKLSDFEKQSIEFNFEDGLINITGFPINISNIIINTITKRDY